MTASEMEEFVNKYNANKTVGYMTIQDSLNKPVSPDEAAMLKDYLSSETARVFEDKYQMSHNTSRGKMGFTALRYLKQKNLL